MKIGSRFSLVLALCGIGMLSAMAQEACNDEPITAPENGETAFKDDSSGNASQGTFDELVGSGQPPSAASKLFPQRYLVTYMGSDSKNLTRSATAVTVTNLSNTSCEVQVTWYKGARPGAPACTTNAVIKAGFTHDFCSRRIPGAVTVCNSICCPRLTFDEGKAIVSSRSSCGKIGVDSRVYYTVGENDADVSAVSNPNIVEITSQSSGSR
jgi:hypothetical protein